MPISPASNVGFDTVGGDHVAQRDRILVDAEYVGVAGAVGVADAGGAGVIDFGCAGELGFEHGVLVTGLRNGE